MKLLDIVHPAAKTLVDVSLAQDAEVRAACCTCRLRAGNDMFERNKRRCASLHSSLATGSPSRNGRVTVTAIDLRRPAGAPWGGDGTGTTRPLRWKATR